MLDTKEVAMLNHAGQWAANLAIVEDSRRGDGAVTGEVGRPGASAEGPI